MRPSVALATCVLIVAAATPRAQLGQISFPTSESGPAQQAFVRGVLNLHNFEYDEAILAFREAQQTSPGFAMAYWGEALANTQPLWYNENLPRARSALAKLAPTAAARAAKAPTAREKAYLDAVEQLFGGGDRLARFRAFADRLAALSAASPDDDEARVFQALALLGTIPEGARMPDISLKAGALASEVLKKNPAHPGAAHYMLHAYDDGEHNGMALEAARIYGKIAPASSHAQHMPSHAYLPLGLWDEAARSDEAAWAASVAWVKRTGRTVNQQDFHALSWLHYEYLQQGRFIKAREVVERVRRALDETARGATNRVVPSLSSEIGRGYDATALKNELANMRARTVIEASDFELLRGQTSFGNIDELFALGLSSLALGETAKVDAALVELRNAAKTLPDRDVADVASIMADELTGLSILSKGQRDAGLKTLANAAAREYARPKPIARPYPPKPAGELYAEALFTTGQASRSVAEYRRVLARTPNRPLSVLGLARAARAAGDGVAAVSAANEFLRIWRAADADRRELVEARALAARTEPRR